MKEKTHPIPDYDLTCLAENVVFPADFSITGLNLNEMVIGATGTGKTVSISLPRGLHTYHSSIVIPIAKRKLKNQLIDVFKNRGYKTIDFDLSNPSECQYGYDPLAYCQTDEDIITFAKNVIGGQAKGDENQKSYDPYWDNSAASVLAAVILLFKINEQSGGKHASLKDILRFFRQIELSGSSITTTNVDFLFDALDKIYPASNVRYMWRVMTGVPAKTASCIYSVANAAIAKTFSDNLLELTEKEPIDIEALGKEKTALFITSSPTDLVAPSYLNLFYADMFRILFETAEKNTDYRLKIPVHMICDDFAVSAKINDFDRYISIFRAAGISVTLLLQSLSQLYEMYGSGAGTVILDNCDTVVFTGSMNYSTQKYVSQQVNIPLHEVMSLPLEQFIVLRRGSEPVIARRYQVKDDPLYKEMLELNDGRDDL